VSALWWLSPVLLPLLAAGVALVSGRARAWLPAVAPLPALLLAVTGPPGEPPELSWLLIGLELDLDGIGRPLLLMSALVWAAAGAAARRLCATDRGFAALFLVTMAGNLGVLIAGDLIALYASFAVMTYAAYGLVVHERSPFAVRAGRVYMVLAVLGEVALLAGVMLTVGIADSTAFEDIAGALAVTDGGRAIGGLLVVGFGIKAGLVPLHLWLPLAHPAAPVAASAVLSAAMIKAGLLGWLRLLPLQEAWSGWGQTLLVLGLTGALLGIVVGLTQRDPKVLLAYSSISQMGLLITLVGVGLAASDASGPTGLTAAGYAVHHGLAKAALFLGVGVYTSGALAAAHRMYLGATALVGLSLAAAPLTGGWVAKQTLKGTVETLYVGPGLAGLSIALTATGAGTTLLIGRLLRLLREPPELPEGRPKPVRVATGSGEEPTPADGDTPAFLGTPRLLPRLAERPLVGAWSLLTAAALVGGWGLHRFGGDAIATPEIEVASLWDGLWPVSLGLLLLAGVAWRRHRFGLDPPPGRGEIPAGDVLLLVVAAGHRLRVMARRVEPVAARTFETLRDTREVAEHRIRPGPGLDRVEELITRWRSAGILLALVGAALIVALALDR
jgi:formate hydrogenlyase subunit 3/multisubunit Na+/H+ antiporter MnhD subunit